MGSGRVRVFMPLAFSLFLLSCGAKHAAQRIAVVAPPNYRGPVHIQSCVSGAASDQVVLSAAGEGQTSFCAVASDVVLVVMRGGHSQEVTANALKTGDGIVTSIEAEVK